MKTKILSRLAIAAILAGTLFVACKKSSAPADNGTSSADIQVQSDDQANVSNETDAIENDANTAMGSYASVSGASTQSVGYGQGKTIEGVQGVNTPLICDATITVDSSSDPRTITLTYNGTGCNPNRVRNGVVVISIPANKHWRDTGAVVTVKFESLKITNLINLKSITINGTHTYTNVSGGSLLALYEGVSKIIVHSITSSNMSITFDNNAQRTWSVARQRTWTYANQNVTITTTGMHSDGSTAGISEWGTNRFGNTFETVIAPTNPLVIQSGCSWNLTSGQVQVIRPDVTTTVTFGLDANGKATGCPVTGTPFYFKLVWQGPNQSNTFILPY